MGECVGGTVAAIRIDRSRRGKLRVEIEGAEALLLARPVAAHLALGQQLTDREIASLREADAVETAVQKGMRLVALRPRSERELRDAFRRARLPEGVQDAALERLREIGAADDAAFARAWVENRQAFRPRSRLALKMELKEKGILAETISAALEAVDEEDAAMRAARAASRRLNGLTAEEFRRRLGGYLARRGFDYATIRPVVDRLWSETPGARGK
jgi:regulatory protein